jgi:murE/murF fusion protein
MLLGNLLNLKNKKYKKIPISGISFDSRNTKEKNIFFSIKKKNTTGNKFINEALLKGASAIISEKKVKLKNKKIPNILVKDIRKSLSEVCSKFYKKKPFNLIAVTGTNGKSSVADFFYQILSLNKIKAASIGTLGIVSKKYKKKTNLTSLDPLYLHKSLQILSENKVNNVILEASSHGLQQRRLDN